MIAGRARVVTASYAVADVLMTAGALWFAHALRRLAGGVGEAWLGPVYDFTRYLPLLALILPLWLLIFRGSGLYRARANRNVWTELPPVARAIGIGGLLLGFVLFTFRLTYVSRPVVLLFVLVNGAFVLAGRAAVRRLALDAATHRYLLVAGDREEVQRTVASVEAHADWGLSVVGLVSDGRWTEAAGCRQPVMGTYQDIPALIGRHVIDEVLIVPAAGRLDEIKALEPVFLRLEEQGIVTRLLVNFLPRSLSEILIRTPGRPAAPHVEYRPAQRDAAVPAALRGRPRFARLSCRRGAAGPGDRPRDQVLVGGAGVLPPDAVRAEWPALHLPEVPLDVRRCRGAEARAGGLQRDGRPRLQDDRRSARHAGRRLAAALEPR